MNSLFEGNNPQVEILNFQTFSTEYVAERYGVSTTAIREHKRLHADEMLECVHFVIEINKFRKPVIKWTLRGIIKLGMFIRSEKAKGFRLWAEQELEKTILSELAQAKEAKARNVELAHKYADLEAYAKFEAKRQADQINGYKGQLAKHNAVIVKLKNELNKSSNERALLQQVRNERDFFRKKYNEIYKILKIDKNKQVILNLAKIQAELEKSYLALGAVMAYVDSDDRFFMEQNEILKG